jgi:hypothetical protein
VSTNNQRPSLFRGYTFVGLFSHHRDRHTQAHTLASAQGADFSGECLEYS